MNKQNGFSLIEAVVAMLLFSIVSLGLTAMAIITIQSNHTNAQMTTAISLAQSRIEAAKTTNVVEGTEDYGWINSYPKFKRVTSIQTDTDSLITIEVKVYWDEDRHKVSLRTSISKN